ncbi:MAG TPA: cytidine deaminase [Thermoanaerobaculia bacterium]|jgi:cytidine deaminase
MQDHHGVIAADQAQRAAEQRGLTIVQLMFELLPDAARYARPPISNYRVGAVCRGTSTGNLYFGANIEFPGQALSFTVHAEQSAVTNAWLSGEEGIDLLAVSAAPCGYCRQFLNELTTAGSLVVALQAGAHPLSHFLPEAFGPRDLGIDGGLMQPQSHGLTVDSDDAVVVAALAAANRSYAPYSKNYSGVAVRSRDGSVAVGAYAENAAFNPSMSPLEVALSRLNLAGGDFAGIERAVLVEAPSTASQREATEAVLRTVCGAKLEVVRTGEALP